MLPNCTCPACSHWFSYSGGASPQIYNRKLDDGPIPSQKPDDLPPQRPDLSAPLLDIHHSVPELLAPGYLFVAAWKTDEVDVGPYIYDTQGHLIWSGAGTVNGALVMNLHVCLFDSKPHLCFFEGRPQEKWGRGRGVVMDSRYKEVTRIENDEISLDMHELHLINEGTSALVTAYTVDVYDGASLNLGRGFSWLLNGHFLEIDAASGEVIFDWNALEHIAPSTSTKWPYAPAGRTRLYPYDFFHLNSVAKSQDGDYIISARHMNAVYKISHDDGHVVWQLGGLSSNFSSDFSLCEQHHVRIQAESHRKTVLSIFNNGCFTDANITASGMLVEIDHTAMTASLLKEFKPKNKLVVESQGSLEIMPKSGNALVGWGHESMITEHTANGEIIFNATLRGSSQSYRTYKAEWQGHPTGRPNTYSYARTLETSTVIYVSWNGATDVAYWRFHGRNDTGQPFEILGTIPKEGFETNFTSNQYLPITFAEALSQYGQSIRNSSARKTFIPSPELAEYCSDILCPIHSLNLSLHEPQEAEAAANLQALRLDMSQSISFTVILLLLCGLATATFAAAKWCRPAEDRVQGYTLLQADISN